MTHGKRKRDYAKEYARRIERARKQAEQLGMTGQTAEKYARQKGRGFHPTEAATAKNVEQYEKTQKVRQEINELIDAAVANAQAEGRKVKRTELRKEIGGLISKRNAYIRAWVRYSKKLGKNVSAQDLVRARAEFDAKYGQMRKDAMQAKLELSAITGSNRETNFKIWRDTP